MRRGGLVAVLTCVLFVPFPANAQDAAVRQLARDLLEELIEINTVTATGDTLRAAEKPFLLYFFATW